MPDDTRTPVTRDDFKSTDWSALPALIRRALPPRAGFDPQTGRRRYQCSQDELDRLADSADTALVAAACSLRCLGLLMIHANHGELSNGDRVEIGDTITTLSELVLALRDVEEAASHGQPTEEATP